MISKKVLFSLFLMSSVAVFPGRGKKGGGEPTSPTSPTKKVDPAVQSTYTKLSLMSPEQRQQAIANLQGTIDAARQNTSHKQHATAVLAMLKLNNLC